jgi:8-oxo-dGTP diphosphatase
LQKGTEYIFLKTGGYIFMFIVNVEGAIIKEGKWLLIKRSEKEEHAGGSLSLVGGIVEIEGFTKHKLERTLKREIAEEVGVQVSNVRYVNSSSFVTEKGMHVVDIVFLCDHESGVAFAKSTDEVEGVFWLTTEEILADHTLPDYLRNNIKDADRLLDKNVTVL